MKVPQYEQKKLRLKQMEQHAQHYLLSAKCITSTCVSGLKTHDISLLF